MKKYIQALSPAGFLMRTETDRVLTLSMIFSVVMVLIRVSFTGSFAFLFLVWNLFLAWLPYALTNWAQLQPKWYSGIRYAFVFLVWLLFVPNSFYIITDLFHIRHREGVMLWFDLVMILSFAWNGLLLGLISVRQMEKMTMPRLRGKHELLFIFPIMWMNAWGVYIGRYMRFNSWDIITNPFALIADIAGMLIHPIENKYAWGMIAIFAVLMTLMYMGVKKISKVIH